MSLETAFEVGRLYLPMRTIADAMTVAQGEPFIKLPGVIGYFPMSSGLGLGKAVNHLGGMPHLNQQGTVPVGYEGNAYRRVGSGTNYLYETTTYGLLGTETWIDSSIRGFTIGGWFKVLTSPDVFGGLISKNRIATERGYALHWPASNEVTFLISVDGTNIVSVNTTPRAIGIWSFIVARFIPSTEIAVFVDGVKWPNTTSIPASCNLSAQQFEVGRYYADDNYILDANVRDVFICQSALSDTQIEQVRVASTP